MSAEGRPETNPLVYDGGMYISSPPGIVEALDAVEGDLLWRYRHEYEIDLGGIVTTRNLAIYDDKVYVTTFDAHVVALDAVTGSVVWDVAGADPALGFRYTAGPIVVRGNVIASTNGCDRFYEAKEAPCFISARDAETGEEVWRTSTVARPGEPGGDTWGDTPLMFCIGGDSWTAGSYDPGTDLIYWATAQAKPWARFQRGHSGDALYTNSVLALDPDTGDIVWYNQLLPGETHDMDETFENLLEHDPVNPKDLDTKFKRYEANLGDSNNFVCENIFELTVVFTVEYTELDRGRLVTRIERIPIISTGGDSAAETFRFTGNGIKVDDGENVPFKRGRISSVDLSITVLTDSGIATLRKANFTGSDRNRFLAKNSYRYSKTILLPQP